jgi:hypothetical protein
VALFRAACFYGVSVPVLTNPRYEQFAVLAAKGIAAAEAYVSAGFAPRGARGNASRLIARDIIRARVNELIAGFSASSAHCEISVRAKRVESLDDRWKRLKRVIEARAIDLKDIPGGDTGLLVRQLKSVGFGENNQLVEEYAVDTGLLKEMRAHEEQAAKELGQWTQRPEDEKPATKNVLPEWLKKQLIEQQEQAGDTSHSQPNADSTATSDTRLSGIRVQ